MKVVLGYVILFVCAFSCKDGSTSYCIDESKKKDAMCTMDYKPVCGCDDKTYSNSCNAEAAGVKSWKEGECITKN